MENVGFYFLDFVFETETTVEDTGSESITTETYIISDDWIRAKMFKVEIQNITKVDISKMAKLVIPKMTKVEIAKVTKVEIKR